MMEPTQHGPGAHDKALAETMSRVLLGGQRERPRRIRETRPQRHVRARAVVVRSPISQEGAQVPFGHRNQPVQTLSPDRSDCALADRVGLRATERRLKDLEAESSDRFIQALREDAVPIVDQIAVAALVSKGFTQLLKCPGCCRMSGERSNAAAAASRARSSRTRRAGESSQ